MKRLFSFAALVCALLITSCNSNKNIKMGSLNDDMDTLSYALGSNVGTSLMYNLQTNQYNQELLTKGVKDGAFEKSKLKKEDVTNTLRTFFMEKVPARMQEAAQKSDSLNTVEPMLFENDEERDSISYALGCDIGSSLIRSNLPIQLAWFNEGIVNALNKESKLTDEQVGSFLQNYFMVVLPAENEKKSTEWLEKMEKKSGVQKTASGLLYKIKKQGDTSVMAKDDRDVVKVNYTGKTRDGKVFDSSIFENMPEERQEMIKAQYPDTYKTEDLSAEFQLNYVIAGWTEGMKLVGKGGVIELWVPADLAYGKRSPSQDIGPNDALYFEVEVLDVKPYVEPAAEATPEAATTPATPAAQTK